MLDTRFVLRSLCLIILLCGRGYSQNVENDLIQKYISSGNTGTEFWVTLPPTNPENETVRNNIYILLVSQTNQNVTVEIPGKGFSYTRSVKANQVTEVLMSNELAAVYKKDKESKAPSERIYPKTGIHITSPFPILVYCLTQMIRPSEGFLAIPVSKLGSDYIVASWPQAILNDTLRNYPSTCNIVAAYDNTKVNVTIGGAQGTRTTGGLQIGESKEWTLNEGDVLCFANDDIGQDLTGSHIVADKPIAVVSGNQCANIPNDIGSCACINEMELPISSWGKEYHIAPISGRLTNPIVRIFSHPDYKDVKVYRDGVEWRTLANSTRRENDAFFTSRIYDGQPHSAVITADAPIYVVLYNTGMDDDGVPSTPFQMSLVPVEHYRKQVTFCIPGAKGGMSQTDNNAINLIYMVGDGNTMPDDIEFGEFKNGGFVWEKAAALFDNNWGELFAKKTGYFEQFAIKQIRLPTSGVFKIRSKNAFFIQSYGSSFTQGSYGFPAYTSLSDTYILDTIPPTLTITRTEKGMLYGTTEDLYNQIVGTKSEAKAANNYGVVASVCLLEDSSENILLRIERSVFNKTDPIKWSLSAEDLSKSAKAIIVSSDNLGNYTLRNFNYSPSGIVMKYDNGIPLFCDLTIAQDDKRNFSLLNLSPDKETEITECTVSDTNNFKIDRSKIIGRRIGHQTQIDIPIVFIPKFVGNYSAIISVKAETGDSATIEIEAKAMRTSLKTDERILFDTTFIDNVSDNDKKITLISESGVYSLPATIIDIRSLPIDGVTFVNGKFGSEGFQIDKSLFVNKTIDSKVSNRIDVPVKFKAIKEGLHKATVFLYLTKDMSVQSIELIGYGKKTVSSVDESDNTDINIYTNVTQSEIVIQGDMIKSIQSYSIINQAGETVLSGTIPEGRENYTISVQNLPAGVYFFTTEINGKKVQEKFVVMR